MIRPLSAGPVVHGRPAGQKLGCHILLPDGKRHPNPKHRSPPDLGDQFDVVAEQPAGPVDNGKSQPHALVGAGFRTHPMELAEDRRTLGLGNAGSRVPDLD